MNPIPNQHSISAQYSNYPNIHAFYLSYFTILRSFPLIPLFRCEANLFLSATAERTGRIIYSIFRFTGEFIRRKSDFLLRTGSFFPAPKNALLRFSQCRNTKQEPSANHLRTLCLFCNFASYSENLKTFPIFQNTIWKWILGHLGLFSRVGSVEVKLFPSYFVFSSLSNNINILIYKHHCVSWWTEVMGVLTHPQQWVWYLFPSKLQFQCHTILYKKVTKVPITGTWKQTNNPWHVLLYFIPNWCPHWNFASCNGRTVRHPACVRILLFLSVPSVTGDVQHSTLSLLIGGGFCRAVLLDYITVQWVPTIKNL